jgi:hypothetical protein
MQIKNLFILLLAVSTQAFDLGLWKGSTHYFVRSNNKIDLLKPIISTYNYTYNFNKSLFHNHFYHNTNFLNGRFLKLKLQSYDKLGGFLVKIDKSTDNSYYFTNQINFFHNTARSIITINYTYNNEQRLELNSIAVSGLRCGLSRVGKIRNKVTNLTDLKNRLKTWRYCKSTKINPRYPYNDEVTEFNCYDYEYLLINEKRISHVFTDNLIISVPEIIDENRPFSLLFGCLVTQCSYKQVNLNYNFNGHLTSIEFNEYEPYNFTAKLDNYLNILRTKLNTLENRTISSRKMVM